MSFISFHNDPSLGQVLFFWQAEGKQDGFFTYTEFIVVELKASL